MEENTVIHAERERLEVAKECLSEMRSAVTAIADAGTSEIASEAIGRLRAERLAGLNEDAGSVPPFFGRIDIDPEDGGQTERFYLGRRHIRNAEGDSVTIDWRAPMARAFYRASASDPMRARLRRRFGFRDGALTSYEDEIFGGSHSSTVSEILRDEITRPRSGPMRDIANTLQPEQDDIIRSGLDTSICVQGAPGTGKTAVGLHRAAFLLYNHPRRLRRSGVLVVGPNRVFLDYIREVLPALGEVGITQASIPQLVGHGHLENDEPADQAALKGDIRMAAVLRRAVEAYRKPPNSDLVIVLGTRRWRIGVPDLEGYVKECAGAGVRWSDGRERLRTAIAADARRQVESRGQGCSEAEMMRIRKSPAVKALLDEVWPELTAEKVLTRLYVEPKALRECSGDILNDQERALLAQRCSRACRSSSWTLMDAVLLDELRSLLAPTDQFLHVVVDEAQDLSAMQCRVIARRCVYGSMTILGDIAQATTAWAPGKWSTTLEYLDRKSPEMVSLTNGYRVPSGVLELANRLLPHIAPEVTAATSIRDDSDALRYASSQDLLREIFALTQLEGSLGVIATDEQARHLHEVLLDLGFQVGEYGQIADACISVIPASSAKGLEFDSVVLVDPARIVASEPSRVAGLRQLYVVLTRAVSRLLVVTDEPMPQEVVTVTSPVAVGASS